MNEEQNLQNSIKKINMKKFFTKILMLEITSRKGLIGWYRKYRTMGKDIRNIYGDLTYENYCKYINSKHFSNCYR